LDFQLDSVALPADLALDHDDAREAQRAHPDPA
jgi:hypothetical protein